MTNQRSFNSNHSSHVEMRQQHNTAQLLQQRLWQQETTRHPYRRFVRGSQPVSGAIVQYLFGLRAEGNNSAGQSNGSDNKELCGNNCHCTKLQHIELQ
ncbi:unnamed protein product [Ceratitis capitata]|uniref:(Mediterranean fruit fly) hypothetical protein n=1 Tax=Ceratitis capitata TaxID=7213 RepID=A0A811UPN7_CERCA|nr:unnamed protein product [Ceratitis capitata]